MHSDNRKNLKLLTIATVMVSILHLLILLFPPLVIPCATLTLAITPLIFDDIEMAKGLALIAMGGAIFALIVHLNGDLI